MKANIINGQGEKIKEVELPHAFSSNVREDVIHKVFVASRFGQPYTGYILAGKKVAASGKQSHARRKWKTTYGKGISRVPRKTLSRRGDRFFWVGAFAPGTVKGREAHPPKIKARAKVNKKERRLAISSAISASCLKELVEKRNPSAKVSLHLPIVIDSQLIERPKELAGLTEKAFNVKAEVEKKIRAGKGKKRGRKYKKSAKVLVVIGSQEDGKKLRNYGVDIARANNLNILALAPGGIAGRMILWTEKAVEEMRGKKESKK